MANRKDQQAADESQRGRDIEHMRRNREAHYIRAHQLHEGQVAQAFFKIGEDLPMAPVPKIIAKA